MRGKAINTITRAVKPRKFSVRPLFYAAHTNLPVPLIYVGGKNVKAVEGGKLSDIAPTMLTLMGMEIPQEMTGKPLFIVE